MVGSGSESLHITVCDCVAMCLWMRRWTWSWPSCWRGGSAWCFCRTTREAGCTCRQPRRRGPLLPPGAVYPHCMRWHSFDSGASESHQPMHPCPRVSGRPRYWLQWPDGATLRWQPERVCGGWPLGSPCWPCWHGCLCTVRTYTPTPSHVKARLKLTSTAEINEPPRWANHAGH